MLEVGLVPRHFDDPGIRNRVGDVLRHIRFALHATLDVRGHRGPEASDVGNARDLPLGSRLQVVEEFVGHPLEGHKHLRELVDATHSLAHARAVGRLEERVMDAKRLLGGPVAAGMSQQREDIPRVGGNRSAGQVVDALRSDLPQSPRLLALQIAQAVSLISNQGVDAMAQHPRDGSAPTAEPRPLNLPLFLGRPLVGATADHLAEAAVRNHVDAAQHSRLIWLGYHLPFIRMNAQRNQLAGHLVDEARFDDNQIPLAAHQAQRDREAGFS